MFCTNEDEHRTDDDMTGSDQLQPRTSFKPTSHNERNDFDDDEVCKQQKNQASGSDELMINVIYSAESLQSVGDMHQHISNVNTNFYRI